MTSPSLTPFKLSLLRSLRRDNNRFFGSIPGHRPHKRRALRDLKRMGLVTETMNDWWMLTRLGAATIGVSTPRAAEQAIADLLQSEQLFEP